jgi:hypothetical protein
MQMTIHIFSFVWSDSIFQSAHLLSVQFVRVNEQNEREQEQKLYPQQRFSQLSLEIESFVIKMSADSAGDIKTKSIRFFSLKK